MNPQIKTRWLRRLRNPRAIQASYTLNNGRGGFCCLGLLCDELKDDLGLTWEPVREGLDRLKIDGQEQYLPESIATYAGLDTKPAVPYPGKRQQLETTWLTDLNDSKQLTFAEIADLIEAYL